MSTQHLEHQVTRILSSQTSKELVSQLKTLNRSQTKIQEELMQKTAQITQLQNYLKNQIQNIQAIVQLNNRLKRQNEIINKELRQQKEENNELSTQLQSVVQDKRKYVDQLKDIELKKSELEQMIENKKNEPNDEVVMVDMETQTDNIGFSNTNKSASTSPAYTKHSQSKLLEKISLLEETIMELKIEKCQLNSRIKVYQKGQTIEETEHQDTPESSMQVKSTTEIIELICQDQLQQVKFRGQIVNGLKEGKGICLYQDHVHFEGTFRQGKRHGLGTLYIYDQPIYRGYWANGLIQGKGILRMLQGQIETYQGQFRAGRLEGYGCMKLKSGKRVIGFWEQGRIKGNCMQSDQRGKRYTKPQLIECY